MSKSTRKKSKNDDHIVAKIYEYVRSSHFFQDLVYDVMSDFKEKPSYKRLKAMIEDFLSKNMDMLASFPVSSYETEHKKEIIAEISMTAFTVDAIVPAMIYSFLNNGFSDIIKDIYMEGKGGKTNGNAFLHIPKTKDSVEAKCESNNNKNIANTVSDGETSKKLTSKRGRGRPRKKSVASDKVNSDTESVISVGNLSLPSVSSVHTSELSSFDDEISLSSDDDDEENGRKRTKLSLSAIQQMYKEGRISEWCAANRNSKSHIENTKGSTIFEPIKNVSQATKVLSDDDALAKTTPILPFPQKILPQRIRKPNSKYSSENIFCPITEKQKKMQEVNGTDAKTLEAEVFPSCKEKQIKNKENEVKPPNKVQEIPSNDKRKDVISVSPSQQKSSDFFKPHPAVHSLTSRKTAPVTLYSTVAKNIK